MGWEKAFRAGVRAARAGFAFAGLMLGFAPWGASAGHGDGTLAKLREIADGMGLRPADPAAGAIAASRTTGHLLITDRARTILRKQAFDEPEPGFDEREFLGKARGICADSIERLDRIVAFQDLREVYLVLTDKGEKRWQNVSSAVHGTRIVWLDVRRWQAAFPRGREDMLRASAFHELVHLVNYVTDRGESRLHRELAAIEMEIDFLLDLWGEARFFDRYPIVAGELEGSIETSEFKDYSTTRNLAFRLARGLREGSFTGNGADWRENFRRVALAHLLRPEHGSKGFRLAATDAGIRVRSTGGTLRLLDLSYPLE